MLTLKQHFAAKRFRVRFPAEVQLKNNNKCNNNNFKRTMMRKEKHCRQINSCSSNANDELSILPQHWTMGELSSLEAKRGGNNSREVKDGQNARGRIQQ